MFAFQDFFEAADCFFQRNILTGSTGKLFSNKECLAEEFLDFTSTGNSQLVVLAQFFHTKNCDNILQFFVTLQNSLYATSYIIVLFTDNQRIKDTAGGVKRVNCRINTKLCNLTGKYSGSVQMSECSCRSRVSQVIRNN